MDARNRDRAFAHGRRDPLGAAAPHVAHREDTWQARFEQIRLTTQRPLRGGKVIGGQRWPRLDESLLIERQAAGEPLRARLGPGHGEDVANLLLLHRSSATRAPRDLLNVSVPFQTHDLRARVQLDARMGFDAADEVARHGLRQAVTADEHVHPLRGLREEHGRLARGVCASDDSDLLIRAQLRLHRGGGVIHAGALEARQVLNRQAPVLDSTRDDDGTGEQRVAGSLAALHAVRLRAAVEPGDLSRDEDLCAELLRLIVGASRQLLAGDAERETEIVLDARAGPCLPARRVSFDHHDVQALRRRVHSRAEAGGSRADDDEVADRGAVDLGIQPETVGDLLDRGIAEHPGATADHDRDVAGAHVELVEHRLAVGVRIQIDELVGMPVAREKLADLQRSLAVIRSEQQHVAEALIDQLQAAQDEGAEENVAQLGVGLDELEQLLARDLDDVRRRARLDASEEAPARQDRPLAREHPLTEARQVLARPAGWADEVEPSRDNHEDLGHRFARFAEGFAYLDFAVPAMGFDAGDLRGRQSWKRFRLSGGLGRGCWSSWGGGHDLNTIPQGKSFRHGPTMQASRAGSRRPAQNA